MQLLVLAGKTLDSSTLEPLLAGHDFISAQYTTVSRGVRRLEKEAASAVLLFPDEEDASWRRAIERIQREYGTQVILVGAYNETMEKDALEAGAFDVLDKDTVTPHRMRNILRHLEKQIQLEGALNSDNAMFHWVEEAARLGTWEMSKDGRMDWSDGLRRILSGGKGLSSEFNSIRQYVHPEDLDIYDQANKATFDQGWPLDFEYRVKVDDDTRYLHLHRRVNHGKNGKVESAYGMMRDVTAEREFENFLFRRDAILQVVSSFAERFLRESNWETGLNNALKDLGKAADVTRCFVFRKSAGPDLDANISMVYEWAAPMVEPYINSPLVNDQPFSAYARWRDILLSRKTIGGTVSSFQAEERRFFELTHTKSIILVPVFVGEQWWGFIGVSEHREERDWMPTEIEALNMMADIFGSAILRRSMEDQLMEANRSAEDAKVVALEASKAKSRFLANMSHEIRTPISGILGMAEMTITTGLKPDQREHLDMIRDAAGSLLTIVNDVLDLSKIEAEKMELKPVDFDFRAELETTMRPFNPEAERKGIDLHYAVGEEVPPHLHGDPDRLGQVVRNLISNAIKFTERGQVDMHVELIDRSLDGVCLKFTVTDTGEGIDLKATGDIFESFTQADSSTRKKHQGTGLGLTISRELVRMMDGDIEVESEPGKGSSFCFSAWFGEATAPAAKVKAAPAKGEGLRLNLLLAEDNPLNQKFLTHFLTMFGHTVTHAGNGLLALEALRHQGNNFDLILMDIQMPEMGGLEATRVIRESNSKEFDSNIPIIALTAYAMKGDKERMIDAGMNDYVSKPVDMKKLSAAIARCITEKRSAEPKQTTVVPGRSLSQPSGITVELDMDSLVERFEGNMELLKEILDLFLSESDMKLAKLDAGLKSGNVEDIAMALHSITNIASHVLAMEIVETSRALERKCHKGDFIAARSGILGLRPKFVALVNAVRERVKTL